MKQGGNVIYVGSSSAMKGRGKFPLYSASKAALNNFTESMAERYQEKNIRFNCVNPAQTLTDMLANVNLPADPARALSVEYVARVIISYCDTPQTGQIINIRKNVDGAT
jgi:NAD(P)-dependent dehydrogenase (short-subunit alcohol dehydrogenase family)